MKIVVCIKQVPDTADIKWTANNTIQREGMESIINPFDEYALETALKIKDKRPETEITVLTMGPMQAEEMLRKAIARGADKAYLLSDKKFAGSDTVATSKTLAAAIRKFVPDFDLIICGQFAIDGDTAQTGPSIAQYLDIAQITYVKNVDEICDSCVTVTKETEIAAETLKAKLPALLCMLKCEYELRPALIDGYITAHEAEIDVLNIEAIELSAEEAGMKGSPTYVSAAFRPEQKTPGEKIIKNSAKEYAEFLNEKVKELKTKMGNNDKQ